MEDEEGFTDAADAMRTVMMELQGMQYGNQLTSITQKEEKKIKKQVKKHGVGTKEVEDDYLIGPMSAERICSTDLGVAHTSTYHEDLRAHGDNRSHLCSLVPQTDSIST